MLRNNNKETKTVEKYSITTKILIILFGISIIYFIILSIFQMFSKKDIYDINDIEKYIKKENSEEIDDSKIVKDYTTFYTVQGIIEQFVNELINRKYSKTYSVLGKEMLKKYSKADYIEKIKEFSDANFIEKDPDYSYSNVNELRRLYLLSDNYFLAEYEAIDGSTKKIGIRLLNQNKYEIFYIEM